MKNIWRIAFIILLVAWILLWYFSYQKINYLEQEILDLTTETTVIETIWDMTCVWSWVNGEIRWHATCTYSWFNSKLYSGSFYNHNLNWYWIVDIDHQELNEDSALILRDILQEWYFYNWKLKIWKIWGGILFEIWFFEDDWNLRQWMREFFWGYDVWDFVWWVLFNWYSINSINFKDNPSWCKEYKNGVATDITKTVTKTVTNTVYRNNNIKLDSPLWDFYKLWSKYNPYTVQLELK